MKSKTTKDKKEVKSMKMRINNKKNKWGGGIIDSKCKKNVESVEKDKKVKHEE